MAYPFVLPFYNESLLRLCALFNILFHNKILPMATKPAKTNSSSSAITEKQNNPAGENLSVAANIAEANAQLLNTIPQTNSVIKTRHEKRIE